MKPLGLLMTAGLLLLFFLIGANGQCANRDFPYSLSGIEKNPLRGFIPYQGSAGKTFPCSMEFNYIAMKDIVVAEDTYSWTVLDSILTDVSSRLRQTVFRVYLDYPDCCPDGTYNTGVPAFLTTGKNPVTFTPYTNYGGGQSPDYTNERLIVALERMIVELGKRYDGDKRVGFIQVGILGFWGEWHTYPLTQLMALRAVQTRILQAFHSSFLKTLLVVSADELNYWSLTDTLYPKTTAYRIGWHDDSFAFETYSANSPQSYFFYNRLSVKNLLNRYKYVPIAGEIYPDIQNKLFNLNPTGVQNFTQCVQNTHPSWLLNQFAFDDTDPARIERTKQAALQLGYQFYISNAKLEKCSSNCTNCYRVSITVENRGSAPFYYPIYLRVNIETSWPVFKSSFWIPQSLSTIYPGSPPTVISYELGMTLNSGSFMNIQLVSNFVLAPIVPASAGVINTNILSVKLDQPCS